MGSFVCKGFVEILLSLFTSKWKYIAKMELESPNQFEIDVTMKWA